MKKLILIIIVTFLSFLISVPVKAEILINEPISPIPDIKIPYPDRVELGRILFHDVRLSKGAQVSCASCHSMKMGGADGQIVSTGINSQKGAINSPTVFNSSLNFHQFWNGRSNNLLEQIDGPIANPKEMGFSWKRVINILSKDSFYIHKFNQSYPDGLTITNIKNAIVSFEESLLTPNSSFDQYLKGNTFAISNKELAGYQLFKQYGCVSCHQGVAVGGNLFQKMGAFGDYFADRGNITEADYGRFTVTKREADRFVFKVPSLRNVALTAPYFHDGTQRTLDEAVSVMMKYQLGRIPEKNDILLIVTFLKTLTGQYQGKLLQGQGQTQ